MGRRRILRERGCRKILTCQFPSSGTCFRHNLIRMHLGLVHKKYVQTFIKGRILLRHLKHQLMYFSIFVDKSYLCLYDPILSIHNSSSLLMHLIATALAVSSVSKTCAKLLFFPLYPTSGQTHRTHDTVGTFSKEFFASLYAIINIIVILSHLLYSAHTIFCYR